MNQQTTDRLRKPQRPLCTQYLPGDTPKLRPLPGAGQNLSVNDGRTQKRLGVGIFRVPSDQEKNTKPTLGRRGCRELEHLIKTLLRVCGKIGDSGLAVDAEHYRRGRALGGHNTMNAISTLASSPSSGRTRENARVDVGAGDLLPPTVTLIRRGLAKGEHRYLL